MFQILWIFLCTATLLPLGIAYLRGWTPGRSRGSDPRATRARGVAALALYGSSMTPAVLSLAGIPGDELLALRITAGPILILTAVALIFWAHAAERRSADRA
ncbi:hypothetical protein [Streptomyces sp. NPDC093105]|uniref:hypothetical protein n=1 Tax=Streptomyces sp. NPDC093105 TaxID=3366029 RepID=UPI00380FD8B9